MTNTRNRYNREFKLEAIKLVEEHGRNITEVAQSLDIGKSTLHKWLSQYRKEIQGEAPATGKALTAEQLEIQQLRKQVKQLTMERDILKKASALLALDNLNVYR